MMVAKFVVGVDGSLASGRALVWATRLAAKRGAVVEPIMTWHFPPVSPTVLGDALAIPPFDDLEASAHAQLDSLLESTRRLRDPGATLAEGRVLQGAAGPVLCDAAEDADLLVIGSRGYGGFKGLVLGSVSAHCANAAPGPVAVIPHDWEPDGATGVVVVGVDGSSNSDAAITWADNWSPPEATLRLVHSWTYPVGYNAETVAFDPVILEDGANEMLDQAAALVKDHKSETVCLRGDGRHLLNEQAADSDMLVIGSRGRTGIIRLLLGSVASAIVHHLQVPTILVRGD
jgi:nucleotide-binding universal stress UspA family protein